MRRPIISSTAAPGKDATVRSIRRSGRRRTWIRFCAAGALLTGSLYGIVQATQSGTTAAATLALGSTAGGKTVDVKDANTVNGSRYQTDANGGQVTALSIYVGTVDAAPHNQYQVAIYSDQSGMPGNLVAASATGVLTAKSWNSLSLSVTLSPNTAYWLMYNTNGSNGSVNNLTYTGSSTMMSAYIGSTFGSWPATLGRATLGFANYSIYATLAAGTSGTSTATPTLPAATSTSTPVPPTATDTATPTLPAATSTSTPVPPTATSTTIPVSPPSTSGCGFQSAPQPVSVAFCDTFNSPAGIGNRSGDLNGTLWGVSRWTGDTNLGNPLLGWSPVQEDRCGTTVQVQPENDVSVCNGRLVEGTNDATSVTSLAMYPKQPFDIAGRTGTASFDVSNNTQGSHASWPEFWYTDKPVPAPFIHEGPGGSQNSFGVRFAAVCPAGQGGNCGSSCPSTNTAPVFTVDSAVVVRNWQVFDTFMGTGGGLTLTDLNCVTASTGPGNMNHVELRISQNEIDVYATDAGTTGPLKEIATITNANLTLTRGLIWLEDVHYNGNKLNTQRTNTFSWDNVGFDGPTLPRDLAFDANDSLTPTTLVDGSAGVNLGWEVPADGTSLSLSVPNVSGVAQASGGLLTYNFYSYAPVTISYSLNSGPWHAVPWPYPDSTTYSWRTLAVPIDLSEVRAGTNTVQFKASDGAVIANVDLIMAGAGAHPGRSNHAAIH